MIPCRIIKWIESYKKACRPSDALLYLVQHSDEGNEERAVIAIISHAVCRGGEIETGEDRKRKSRTGRSCKADTLQLFSRLERRMQLLLAGACMLRRPESEIARSRIRSHYNDNARWHLINFAFAGTSSGTHQSTNY